jgi:hypothetical protein
VRRLPLVALLLCVSGCATSTGSAPVNRGPRPESTATAAGDDSAGAATSLPQRSDAPGPDTSGAATSDAATSGTDSSGAGTSAAGNPSDHGTPADSLPAAGESGTGQSPSPPSAGDSSQLAPAGQPASGYPDAPAGIAFVGDARVGVFYPISCAAGHRIPRDDRIYFLSEAGAVRDGFRRSGDC